MLSLITCCTQMLQASDVHVFTSERIASCYRSAPTSSSSMAERSLHIWDHCTIHSFVLRVCYHFQNSAFSFKVSALVSSSPCKNIVLFLCESLLIMFLHSPSPSLPQPQGPDGAPGFGGWHKDERLFLWAQFLCSWRTGLQYWPGWVGMNYGRKSQATSYFS